MMRLFSGVAIKVEGVDIGAFGGVVEFSVHPDQVDIVAIHVDAVPGTQWPILTLREDSRTVTSAFLFNLLRAALLQRFASDLLTYAAAIRAREPVVLRSVA